METRPASDFETAEHGQALLNYALEYRRMVNPKASFSEVIDNFTKQESNGNHLNGKTKMSGRSLI